MGKNDTTSKMRRKKARRKKKARTIRQVENTKSQR